jgi:hypothetical protein
MQNTYSIFITSLQFQSQQCKDYVIRENAAVESEILGHSSEYDLFSLLEKHDDVPPVRTMQRLADQIQKSIAIQISQDTLVVSCTLVDDVTGELAAAQVFVEQIPGFSASVAAGGAGYANFAHQDVELAVSVYIGQFECVGV